MRVLAALLTLCVAASVTLTSQLQCLNPIDCPCGSTKTNITICPQTDDEDPCEEWLRCKNCEGGQNSCLECEDGYEGPLCSIPKKTIIKSRQKRQYYYPDRRPQRPGNRNPTSGFCPDLESPKLGSIRCVSNNQQRTCTGRCLPGYSYEIYDAEEITVVCTDGSWQPLTSFPACKSEGYCDLIVQGAGSFNCTTGMDGTRCDVFCARRYIGRYFCYPGRPWEPSLPGCVRPKELSENLQSCSCLYGGSCDRSGSCICPAGRTGTYCETVIPQKRTCRDPGFINNGFRRKPDGSQLLIRRTFEEGDSVVYGCTTEDFALQGSSLLTCRPDGSWSSPLPKCIKPVAPEIMCPDPGQVANADRFNSDGSPSVGVQQYRIGQSVVYSCHSGYALQYRSLITCLATGAWSSRTPFCSRITSPTPVTRTTPSPPTALRFCRDPGDEPNGSRQPRRPPNRRGFPQGSPVEYFCNSGYDLIGERIIYCSISGDWSASRPKCEPQSRTPDVFEPGGLAYCLNPGSIANGRFVYYPSINNRRRRPSNQDSLEPEYPENSQLEYSCNAGYSLQGSASLTCLMSGVWSAEAPVCTKDDETVSYCRNPGPISNGQVVYVPTINERRRGPPDLLDDEMEDEMPQGSRLQYSCDRGYTLVGASTITCEDPGVWSAASPTCASANPTTTMYCNNPGFVLNGRVTYFPPATGSRNSRPGRFPEDQDEFAEGTRLEYSCEDGYILQGSETLRCQSTGFWSSERPNCDSDCGRSFVKATMERILHGVKTVNGEWPWVVALATVENNVSQIVCGGAVLNSRTVLTAAHCLTRASRFKLYFGKLHLRDTEDDAEVLVRRSTRLIIHPDFSITSVLDSDIGLILFEPRVPFSVRIQPICLPTADTTARNLMTGRRGYVTGWGLTERNLQSDDLMMASLPFLTNEACIDSYRRQNITLPITRNMFCAGFEDAEQSVCEGDSGSPLVFYDQDRFTVEGVVSFGVQGQCGLPGRYSVFTKVYRFLPWILRNLQ